MDVSALTATLLLLLKCPVRPLCLYACSREPPKRQNAHGRRQPTPCLSINWYSAPSAKSFGWLVEFTGWELAAASLMLGRALVNAFYQVRHMGCWQTHEQEALLFCLVLHFPILPNVRAWHRLVTTSWTRLTAPLNYGAFPQPASCSPVLDAPCGHTGRWGKTWLTEAHSSGSGGLSPTLPPPPYSLFWHYIWFQKYHSLQPNL